jgi:hypothetical protein
MSRYQCADESACLAGCAGQVGDYNAIQWLEAKKPDPGSWSLFNWLKAMFSSSALSSGGVSCIESQQTRPVLDVRASVMYACMHACMHVCMHVCMYACMPKL